MANYTSLPDPKTDSEISLEQTILKRRSVRKFSNRDLSLEQTSQILWAAQGITDKKMGFRSAPSAGAIYPLEIYIVKSDGLFRYIPDGHKLQALSSDDLRSDLSKAALGQGFVKETGADIVITAVFGRIAARYGQRGTMYAYVEAGHVAQNIHLQAVSLGLGSCPVGAFNGTDVKKVLSLPEDEEPIYIIPVGYLK